MHFSVSLWNLSSTKYFIYIFVLLLSFIIKANFSVVSFSVCLYRGSWLIVKNAWAGYGHRVGDVWTSRAETLQSPSRGSLLSPSLQWYNPLQTSHLSRTLFLWNSTPRAEGIYSNLQRWVFSDLLLLPSQILCVGVVDVHGESFASGVNQSENVHVCVYTLQLQGNVICFFSWWLKSGESTYDFITFGWDQMRLMHT